MKKIIIDVQTLSVEQRNYLLMGYATSEFFLSVLMKLIPGAMQVLAKDNNEYLADIFRCSQEQDNLLQEYLTVEDT